jgi:hypothetical protein
MPAARPRANLDHELGKSICELWQRIRIRQVADLLWEIEFTANERVHLGDEFPRNKLAEAYSELRAVTLERAVVELAYAGNLLELSRKKQLLLRLNETPIAPDRAMVVPTWNAASMTLDFRGRQIWRGRICTSPTAPKRLIDAFDAAGWPALLENPLLTLIGAQETHRLLSRINKRLAAIRFFAQQGAATIGWQLRESEVKSE